MLAAVLIRRFDETGSEVRRGRFVAYWGPMGVGRKSDWIAKKGCEWDSIGERQTSEASSSGFGDERWSAILNTGNVVKWITRHKESAMRV